MNTGQIRRLLNSKPTVKQIFKGVFALDKIPSKITDLPSCLVVNFDKSFQPGSHWVALYISNLTTEYFDSYGSQPTHDSILKLLKDNYLYNAEKLQNPITTVCGQYCIFFLWKKSCGWSMEKILDVFSDDTFENDFLVNDIIETYFKVDLQIIDSDLIEQICKPFKHGSHK